MLTMEHAGFYEAECVHELKHAHRIQLWLCFCPHSNWNYCCKISKMASPRKEKYFSYTHLARIAAEICVSLVSSAWEFHVGWTNLGDPIPGALWNLS